jgi:hypothetical protein
MGEQLAYLFAVYRNAPKACDFDDRTLVVSKSEKSGTVTLPGLRIAAESAVFVE